MKTRIEQRLRDESARFAFRFACEDCVHVDAPGHAGGLGRIADSDVRCSLGYPAAPRRSALSDEKHRGSPCEAHLELCKAFELG